MERGVGVMVATLALSACVVIVGNGVSTTQVRTLGPFTRVANATSLDVTVDFAATHQAKVVADANLIDRVHTEVQGASLVVWTEGSVSFRTPSRVEVTTLELDGVTDSGSGEVVVSDVASPAFDVVCSGSGEVVVSGGTGQVTVTSSGSGGVDASNLQAETADVTSSGSGTVQVWATRRVDVTLTGSGDVLVFGNPPTVDVTDTGSGSVRLQ